MVKMPAENAMGPNNKTEIVKFSQKEIDLNIKNILFIIFNNELCCIK